MSISLWQMIQSSVFVSVVSSLIQGASSRFDPPRRLRVVPLVPGRVGDVSPSSTISEDAAEELLAGRREAGIGLL